MKVTINGSISKEALKIILETQKVKVTIIDEFCKTNKIQSLNYKDSELEYNYETKSLKNKVEVRIDDKGN